MSKEKPLPPTIYPIYSIYKYIRAKEKPLPLTIDTICLIHKYIRAKEKPLCLTTLADFEPSTLWSELTGNYQAVGYLLGLV